jgi:gas vesicle protein
MRKRNGDASFLFGLVLGIFIGAAVAMVLTPRSGEANRARLAEKAKEITGSVEGRTRDMLNKT